MRILHRHGEIDRQYDLRVRTDGPVTLGEIAAAIGVRLADTAPVTVDGVRRPAATDLAAANVVEGSTLDTTPGAHDGYAHDRHAADGATLDVVSGLCAGLRSPVRRRRVVAGASVDCDLSIPAATVSPHHLAFDPGPDGLTATDLDSLNGTLVDGTWLLDPILVEPNQLIDLGATQLRIRPPANDRPLELLGVLGRSTTGILPFNRPPRTDAAMPGPPIAVPCRATPDLTTTLFSWASLIAPIVLGGLMAWLYNPLFALFALMSPVMMIGTWIEGRRRRSRTGKRHARALARSLAALRTEMEAASGAELEARHARSPDLAEVVRRAQQPSTRLWERRPVHDDAMQLVVGTTDQAWEPTIVCDGTPEPSATEIIDELRVLADAPLSVNLAAGAVVGIVGDRTAALAIARSLVTQAAVHHGPADLEIVVLAGEPDTVAEWRWASWLPHTRCRATRGRTRAIAAGTEAIAELVGALHDATRPPDRQHLPAGRLILCVIDGDGLTTGRTSPARALLSDAAGPAGGIVIASSLDRLPAACTSVIDITDSDGLISVISPVDGTRVNDVLATGIDPDTAATTARLLARFSDPEVDLTEASIPESVPLLQLLGLVTTEADAIEARWQATRGTADLAAPVGADGHGSLDIDLVRDGPHALIGGTTGSGKSELLRSLVASLAATADAAHLNFVLIDYKGGSAFDACAALPHTVGLVTDLDERLGARALRCLDAELHRRERILRDAFANDIVEYRAMQARGRTVDPLPRLVVVIDEFATMAAELPDFLDALVGIAQRGRSLGVHLILATQRPSGAVNANIRTNTNLRIALRVLDDNDSTDVIDTKDAASIGRDQPGRAYARLGPTEVVPFQSALITGHTPIGACVDVEAIPLVDGVAAARDDVGVAAEGPNDLERLVGAIGEAHSRLDIGPPRQPWPDPLPDQVFLDELPPTPRNRRGLGAVPIGLADDPDRQRQHSVQWVPGAGNVIFMGVAGSGTTTALTTAAIALAAAHEPDSLHVYGLDFGSGGLRDLAALPHCGAIIDATSRERQLRLIRHVSDELRRRRGLHADELAAEPSIVVMIDNYGTLRHELEEAKLHSVLETVQRIYADGPPLGIHSALAVDHVGAVGRQFLAVTSQVFLLRFADPTDYLSFGVRPGDVSSLCAGRAFLADSGAEVQLALAHRDGIDTAIERIASAVPSPAPLRPPRKIGELPLEVDTDDLLAHSDLAGEPATLVVAIGDDDLGPAGFELHEGEHVLVAGRARTGKSTALCSMARIAGAGGAQVVALAPRRSPLHLEPACHATTHAGELEPLLGDRGRRPYVLLIDDAESFDDGLGQIAALVAEAVPGFHIVAAGRTDRLQSAYGHWTTALRASRCGVLLCPELLDGDLLGVQLPVRSDVPALPGRGWLVSAGNRQICQLATVQDAARRANVLHTGGSDIDPCRADHTGGSDRSVEAAVGDVENRYTSRRIRSS
ncbi:MAG: FtsK/SpoIIIE domain-containing protein [Acidimicrobiia bacterium]|nr:FtsK/SpoIIIE domain-containing protein [Acidimicrobiia bacterium]